VSPPPLDPADLAHVPRWLVELAEVELRTRLTPGLADALGPALRDAARWHAERGPS
jgi:hypothetical protein